MRESALQRAIVLAIEAAGCYVCNVIVAGRQGTPDLLVCVDGRFLALEVKRPGEHPAPLQVVEAQRVVRAGGDAYIVYDVKGALEFVKALRALPLARPPAPHPSARRAAAASPPAAP